MYTELSPTEIEADNEGVCVAVLLNEYIENSLHRKELEKKIENDGRDADIMVTSAKISPVSHARLHASETPDPNPKNLSRLLQLGNCRPKRK